MKLLLWRHWKVNFKAVELLRDACSKFQGNKTTMRTVTTRITPAFRWAVVWAILMFHSLWRNKVTIRLLPWTTVLSKKGQPKRNQTSVCLLIILMPYHWAKPAPAEVVLDMGSVCRMCLWNVSAAGRDAWQWFPSGDGDQRPERTHQATQLLSNHHRHCYWEIHQVSVHLMGLYSSAGTQSWATCSGSMIYNTHVLSTVAQWLACIVWWKLFKWREADIYIFTLTQSSVSCSGSMI